MTKDAEQFAKIFIKKRCRQNELNAELKQLNVELHRLAQETQAAKVLFEDALREEGHDEQSIAEAVKNLTNDADIEGMFGNPARPLTKIDHTLAVIEKHSPGGIDVNGIMSELQKLGVDLSKNHLQALLSKERQKGTIINEGGRYERFAQKAAAFVIDMTKSLL